MDKEQSKSLIRHYFENAAIWRRRCSILNIKNSGRVFLLSSCFVMGVAAFGCGEGNGSSKELNLKSPAVLQHCAEDRNRPCRENCRDEGKFGYCYKEKGHDPKAIDINWHCYAIHLGKTCKPCENVYSMNFAGAMSRVSCEEFYAFLEMKNKKCDNCLERQDHL